MRLSQSSGWKKVSTPFVRSALSIVVIPVAAFLLQSILTEFERPYSGVFFGVAMYVSASIGTKRDGIVSTIILFFTAWYFFVSPEGTWLKPNIGAYVSWGVFFGCGIGLSCLHDTLRLASTHLSRLDEEMTNAHTILLSALPDGVFIAQDCRFR